VDRSPQPSLVVVVVLKAGLSREERAELQVDIVAA